MLLQQQVAALIKQISQIETHSHVLSIPAPCGGCASGRNSLARGGEQVRQRSVGLPTKLVPRLNSTPNPSMGEMLHKTHSARLDLAKLREQVIDPPFHPARARLTCPDSPDGATAITHCHGDETGCCRVQQNSFRFSLFWLWELVS